MALLKAKQKDALELALLHIAIWYEQYGLLFSLQTSIKQKKDHIKDPNYDIFIYRDKRILGFSEVNYETNEIMAVYVDKTHRRTGIGQKLLKMAQEALGNTSHLWVDVNNKEARDFYERHNFKDTGEKRVLMPFRIIETCYLSSF